jgi:hypothetical protein
MKIHCEHYNRKRDRHHLSIGLRSAAWSRAGVGRAEDQVSAPSDERPLIGGSMRAASKKVR